MELIKETKEKIFEKLKENTFDIDIFNIDKLSENFQEKIKSYQ
jgi:hypothetical protein